MYIVTELVKLVNKMKQIRNSMTILFLLSFCISFVFTASVPMLHDDYGKYSRVHISSDSLFSKIHGAQKNDTSYE